MSESQSHSQLSDVSTTKDLLGFEKVVAPIARRICQATKDDTPFTIGICGEWGSGKTSFLRMIANELQKHEIHPIWFDAWKYEKEEHCGPPLSRLFLTKRR